MIVTFQMITLYGTGDPKLMAGGISQALVTTVLEFACYDTYYTSSFFHYHPLEDNQYIREQSRYTAEAF